MSNRLQASNLLKRYIFGDDARSNRVAAGQWVVWYEDKAGNMIHFYGPMSQSAAKKMQNSPDGRKVLDAGGGVTAAPLDQAVSRHLKPASKAWFTKLPAADKKKLDAVLAQGKTSARQVRPTATNLMLAAQNFAAKAFSKGERYGGRANSTTYPRKWYSKLERMFGILNAVELTYFNDAYNHHLAQLTYEKVLPPPPIPRGMDKQAVRLHFQKRAQGMRIGPGGLEETSKIHMQPDTIYYMGASSSPDMVIVTKVDDKSITYRKYPFKSDQKVQRWIGEDLIAQGSKRWLSSGYAKYNPDIARSLKSMLSGGRGKKINPKDYEPLFITVELAADVRDPYGFVKSWGVLVDTPEDIDDPSGEWTVQADGKRLKEMKRDRNISKIVKTKPA